jgi:hypothetical protein
MDKDEYKTIATYERGYAAGVIDGIALAERRRSNTRLRRFLTKHSKCVSPSVAPPTAKTAEGPEIHTPTPANGDATTL